MARIVVALAFLIVAVGCGSSQKPKPPSQEERADTAVARWAQGLAGDPDRAAGEDVQGQFAVVYRALSTLSPRAGAAVGMTITDIIVSMLPNFLCYWVEGGCGSSYEPHVFLPTGPVGRTLADAGVIEVTGDDRYAMLPARDALAAFTKLSQRQRAGHIARGAARCRMQEKIDEWPIEPLPEADCAIDEQDRNDPDKQDAAFRCLADRVLWDLWAQQIVSIWLVRLDCGDQVGIALLSMGRDDPTDDGLLFAVLGDSVQSILERIARLQSSR